MRLRLAGRYQLVVQPARQGHVDQAVAVDMAHLFAAKAIFGAAEPVSDRVDSRPRRNRFIDQLSCELHTY
jgi:hypothetical protein